MRNDQPAMQAQGTGEYSTDMENTRTEYHLMVNRGGRAVLDSVHPTADSAIATKFKRLNPRAYFIHERVFVNPALVHATGSDFVTGIVEYQCDPDSACDGIPHSSDCPNNERPLQTVDCE